VNVGALAEGEVQEHLREGRPASQLPLQALLLPEMMTVDLSAVVCKQGWKRYGYFPTVFETESV
jgi:hypothetical protein